MSMYVEVEPDWLRAKVDQCLAMMKEKGASAVAFQSMGTGTVMVFLEEPEEHASPEEIKRWEHSCDNCGRYSPNDLVSGAVLRIAFGVRVVISFGVCPVCSKIEADQ